MSANRHRGETEAVLDGRTYTLCLTLGGLAELETAFAASDLGALVARFSGGTLSADDMTKILAAGLRGAGHAVSDDEVRMMRSPDGAAGFARAVADLLAVTFGTRDEVSWTDP